MFFVNNQQKFAQRYRIRAEDVSEARAGQFVFPGDHSDEVCGFIRSVSHDTGSFEVVLFEPTSMPAGAEVLDEECDWIEMLNDVLSNADDELRSMWAEALNT